LRRRDKTRDPVRYVCGRHRPGNEIALRHFAAQLQQQLTVLDTFQPFGNDLPTKRPRQANHCGREGQVVVVMQYVAHKRFIDLDGLGAQALEVAQDE
jgi:hypothetical protein